MIPDAILIPHTFARGEGERGKSGCWMTYGNALVHGQWGDAPCSVDLPIRELCIVINDKLSDKNRTRIIDEFGAWLPFGTAGDPEASRRRLIHLIQSSARIWAADTVESAGKKVEAKKLRALPDLVDSPGALEMYRKTAAAYAAAANAATYATANATYAAYAATYATYAATYATYAANAANATYAATYATYAANAATYATANAANATYASGDKYIINRVLPVLREMITMGPHCPVEADYSDKRCAMVGVQR